MLGLDLGLGWGSLACARWGLLARSLGRGVTSAVTPTHQSRKREERAETRRLPPPPPFSSSSLSIAISDARAASTFATRESDTCIRVARSHQHSFAFQMVTVFSTIQQAVFYSTSSVLRSSCRCEKHCIMMAAIVIVKKI